MGVRMSSATSGAYLSSSIRSFCFLNWTRENKQRLSDEESHYFILLGISITVEHIWAPGMSQNSCYVRCCTNRTKKPLSFPKYLTTEVEVRRKQVISTSLNCFNHLCLALDTADSEFATLEVNTFNLPTACLHLQWKADFIKSLFNIQSPEKPSHGSMWSLSFWRWIPLCQISFTDPKSLSLIYLVLWCSLWRQKRNLNYEPTELHHGETEGERCWQ